MSRPEACHETDTLQHSSGYCQILRMEQEGELDMLVRTFDLVSTDNPGPRYADPQSSHCL